MDYAQAFWGIECPSEDCRAFVPLVEDTGPASDPTMGGGVGGQAQCRCCGAQVINPKGPFRSEDLPLRPAMTPRPRAQWRPSVGELSDAIVHRLAALPNGYADTLSLDDLDFARVPSTIQTFHYALSDLRREGRVKCTEIPDSGRAAQVQLLRLTHL